MVMFCVSICNDLVEAVNMLHCSIMVLMGRYVGIHGIVLCFSDVMI